MTQKNEPSLANAVAKQYAQTIAYENNKRDYALCVIGKQWEKTELELTRCKDRFSSNLTTALSYDTEFAMGLLAYKQELRMAILEICTNQSPIAFVLNELTQVLTHRVVQFALNGARSTSPVERLSIASEAYARAKTLETLQSIVSAIASGNDQANSEYAATIRELFFKNK